jgi:hypothetical protein
MAIKVTLGATENTQQEKPFPKLMKNKKGCIRLVFNEKSSIVIVSATSENAPFFSDCFNINSFWDFNEPITIQNL